MRYDERIIDPDSIRTPFDVGDLLYEKGTTEGYFADHIYQFGDLNRCKYGVLEEVIPDADFPFHAKVEERKEDFCLFLPAEYVITEKKKEVTYRPLTLREFVIKFPIGTTITYRHKDTDDDRAYSLMFTGYEKMNSGAYEDNICLGCAWYSLKELAEKYEYRHISGNWLPFKVEEL